ncbi:gamma-glutamyltransferase family protein [Actinomadura decatromicini]|nr:gamma-glutamyltransferase family protein [Actinomadura decatromicini]
MSVIRPELIGTRGAVSTTHWLASAAGMAVLDRGGNAFDAAVAAGFVLTVVEPHSNGLGGDVSIVAHRAGTGTTTVICGQGPTPAAATIERFQALGLRSIPGSGLLPACVPGAFGAWLRLLLDHGTARLADVLEHAIGYAERGHPLVPDAARAIGALAPLFQNAWPESGRTYLNADGTPPAAGTVVRNRALAETMRRILRHAESVSADRDAQLEAAHAAFYQGFVAAAIGEFAQGREVLDATGRRHRGLLCADDLASWRAPVETPTSFTYGPYLVHKTGPWSQGPVFAQQLALLDGIDLGALGRGSGAYVHTLAEAAKLAFADREAWYGDPDHVAVPMDDLLGPDYNAARRKLIGDGAARDPQPGTPGGRSSWMPRPVQDTPMPELEDWMFQLQSGMPTIVLAATTRPGDTCTVAVADGHGNLVAAVPSGGWLKSSPVIPGLGFPLGTRAQSMWLLDGHPNGLAPGKRPRTTLSPTVVQRDGEPFLAFGTPGGDRQDVWTLQTFLAITEFGLDWQSATEVPLFHSDHFSSSFTPRACRPGVLVVEAGTAPETVEDLRRRGHDVQVVPELSLGSKTCVAGVDRDGGTVRAAAGPRGRQAYAVCM